MAYKTKSKKTKYSHCVKAVKKKDKEGKYNPYAVCKSSTGYEGK